MRYNGSSWHQIASAYKDGAPMDMALGVSGGYFLFLHSDSATAHSTIYRFSASGSVSSSLAFDGVLVNLTRTDSGEIHGFGHDNSGSRNKRFFHGTLDGSSWNMDDTGKTVDVVVNCGLRCSASFPDANTGFAMAGDQLFSIQGSTWDVFWRQCPLGV